MRLSLSTDSYPDRTSVVRLVDKFLPRLTRIPGVQSAGIVSLLIATQLYGVSTHDPLTYAIVLVAFSAAALFASYFAARRVMHLDPMVALRHE